MWEMILVGGDGGLLQTNEREIERLGLQDKIKILGYRDDIDRLMASSQIFVLISNWEGFPLSILEAMRAKLPVIASNVGGVNESVFDGNTGFLVDDKEQLVAKLEKLITDSEKRVEMGENGRESYEKHFTLEKQLEQTFTIYDELLAK